MRQFDRLALHADAEQTSSFRLVCPLLGGGFFVRLSPGTCIAYHRPPWSVLTSRVFRATQSFRAILVCMHDYAMATSSSHNATNEEAATLFLLLEDVNEQRQFSFFFVLANEISSGVCLI